MRIAVISDTHMPKGSRVLPEACVARLRAADLILHVGDLVGRSFLDELRGYGPLVTAVHGNRDEPSLQAELPRERVVEAEGVRIGMVHVPGPAAGRARRLATRFPGCDLVLYGHTHVPASEEHGGVRVVNPGSPTERRSSPRREMLELEVAGGRFVAKPIHLGP